MDTPRNGGHGAANTASPLFRKGLMVSAGVLVLDQISKWWILGTVMQPPRVIPILPFFNLVLGWNRGVSFGLFDSDSPVNDWLLPLVALVITGGLAVWLWRAERLRIAVGIGLIIGGALGNMVDRLRFGAVADFIDLHAWGHHWPAFNVADSGITIGAVVLILDSLFLREKKP
ncbi:MAG: signal peptidase II [Rhodospirillales bacterium]